jgi:hypothetical protein
MIRPNPEYNPFENEPLDDEEFIEPDLMPDGISHVRSDSELELVVKELLHNSKRIDASDVTVSVNHCEVTLSGSVHSQYDRDEAVNIVREVNGVSDVHPDLIVKLNDGILPTDIGRHP